MVGDSETRPLIGAGPFVLPFGKTSMVCFQSCDQGFSRVQSIGLSTPVSVNANLFFSMSKAD